MDDTTVDTGGSSWADWFQGVAGGVIDKAATAAYVTPYDIQALKIKSLGGLGMYQEGQTGIYRPNQGGMNSGTVLLLAGAALVAVLMFKD